MFVSDSIMNTVIVNTKPGVIVPKYLIERYKIKFIGFKSDPNSEKLVGDWLAQPTEMFGPNRFDRYFVYSRVVAYKEEPIEVIMMDVDFGLEVLLDLLRKSIRLTVKHKLKGAIPLDVFGNINRRLLSQMRREHTKLGVCPN